MSQLRGRQAAAATLILVASALVALAMRNPRTYGIGVLCPTRRFLGIYCPGCGATRATYDLLHGELASAFRNNQAMVLVGVPIALWWLWSLACLAATGTRPRLPTPVWLGYAATAGLIAWGVARNLPWPAFDVIRPPPIHLLAAATA